MHLALRRAAARPAALSRALGFALESSAPPPRCCLAQAAPCPDPAAADAAAPLPAMPPPPPLAPPGLSRTFYKRELPCPPAVAFSSEEGQAIFADALAAGTMLGFFRLVEQFRTQDEPAYCGLASVAMVLNALAIDPRRAWKGPWRFFHEQMLDCCLPLEKVRTEGITLGQAACLARCNGAAVDVFPHGSQSLEEFRAMVAAAAATAEHHLVVSYSRAAFLQTGDGHFSPIGGYSPSRDMVLILDTARFKYPPHWVRLEELYAAMAAEDPATGRPRGAMRLGLPPLQDSVLFTLDVRDEGWAGAYRYAVAGAAAAVAEAAAATSDEDGDAAAAALVAAAVGAAPVEAVKRFVAVRMAGSSCTGGVCTQTAAIDTFLSELRGLPLFRAVAAAVPPAGHTPPSQATAQAWADEWAAQEGGAAAAPPADGWADERDGDGGLSSAAAALASVRPAVPGPLLPERLTLLLLLAPAEGLVEAAGAASPAAAAALAALLDVATHNVVASELNYLREQYKELPAVQRAMDAAAPACGGAGQLHSRSCEAGAGAQQQERRKQVAM